MSTTTTNYNLIKPDYADSADVADLNGNADIIDAVLATKQNATDNTLATTDKTIPGAINEVRTEVVANTANITDLQGKVSSAFKMGNFVITTTSGYASLTLAELGIANKTLDSIMCTVIYSSSSGGNLYACTQITATGINIYLRNGITDSLAANGTYAVALIYTYH